jgi:hypothetical protein
VQRPPGEQGCRPPDSRFQKLVNEFVLLELLFVGGQSMLAVVLLIVVDVATMGVLLLVGVYCLELMLAVLPWPETTRVEPLSRLRFAVLIPAHNEQAILGRTLKTLMPTLGPNDRVLVVADNCTDSTAAVARQARAEVIERHDPSRRGKGYAIDFGLAHLQADSPDAVVFLDADCQVESDTLRLLGTSAVTMRRPAQGMTFTDADPDGSPAQTTSHLALRFKYLVRALGLSRLTGLCYLTGTTVALPWSLTFNLRLTDDEPVDEAQLGLDLTVAGNPPLLVPHAWVNRPWRQRSAHASTSQSSLESSYFRTLLTQVPRLFYQGLTRGRPDVIGLAVDLAIPPLPLLAAVWLLTLTAALACVPVGATAWPALLLMLGGGGLILSVTAGWFVHCRKQISLRDLCAALFHVLSPAAVGGAAASEAPARRA